MTLRDHLAKIHAWKEMVDWVGERDSASAWRECSRPDWMLGWRIAAQPKQRAALILFAVGQLRARTLPCVLLEYLAACKNALDVAERWALEPTEEHRQAAEKAWFFSRSTLNCGAAARAAWAMSAAAMSADRAPWAVSSAAAWAIEAVGDDEDIRWCEAIRQRWPDPPWTEENNV